MRTEEDRAKPRNEDILSNEDREKPKKSSNHQVDDESDQGSRKINSRLHGRPVGRAADDAEPAGHRHFEDHVPPTGVAARQVS